MSAVKLATAAADAAASSLRTTSAAFTSPYLVYRKGSAMARSTSTGAVFSSYAATAAAIFTLQLCV